MSLTTTPAEQEEIRRVFAECGGNKAETCRRTGKNDRTVRKYTADLRTFAHWSPTRTAPPPPAHTLPAPAPEAGGPSLPEPVPLSYDPFPVNESGSWLSLSDVHLPYHDVRAVTAAVKDGRDRGAVGVLLNGDVLDCAAVSHHYREPDVTRFEDEIDAGVRFVAWLRSQFPKARIVFKEGNHEWRLPRFLAANAPELGNLKQLQIPALLQLEQYGVEWVQDGRAVMLGRLPVLHGHEFRGGGGVNPARWLFLQAAGTAMIGHFHRTAEHHERSIDGRLHATWAVGCCCYLFPKWLRQNKWNHGWAVIDVHQGGHFTVSNRRMLPDGRVV